MQQNKDNDMGFGIMLCLFLALGSRVLALDSVVLV